jgi:cobalt-zinc-cadmium efflux system outer membrane protein
VFAQTPLTWAEVQKKFEAANPTLRAGQLNIDESKANEITAFLRPNPSLSISLDQFDPFSPNPYRPITNLQPGVAASYLYERMGKRDLRKESAEKATLIATSTQQDLIRNLTYTLRTAFVQTLQAKAVLALAKDNLAYYDKLLEVNRIRFKAGDIAEVDMDRLELQRIQYLSDIQNAIVSVRTAKIILLQLLNDRTPVDQFDIAGPYDFTANIDTLAPRLKPWIRLRPIIAWPKPTARPIPPSAWILDARTATLSTSVSASRCRFGCSIRTRARSCARSSISRATNVFATRRRRRCSATSIRHMSR